MPYQIKFNQELQFISKLLISKTKIMAKNISYALKLPSLFILKIPIMPSFPKKLKVANKSAAKQYKTNNPQLSTYPRPKY